MSHYVEGSIAGVTLATGGGDKFKALLLNAENLHQQTVGVQQFAADGEVHVQLLTVSKGQSFGIRFEFIDTDVLQDILDAIETAMSGAGLFNVTVADDLTSVNTNCQPDYAAAAFKIESQRTHEDVVKGIEFRFITV
jgi:hypothetical protein